MAADPRNFLLNTDYPLDQIVKIITGSDVVVNGTSGTITIVHGLPFTPLPMIQWSNTADFEITNEIYDEAYMNTTFTTAAGQSYTPVPSSTNIDILTYNFSGSDKTVYYRIFCFMPSDAAPESEVEATASIGSPFILNTDFNYMKLAFEGVLTTTSPTFTHNLGFVPRVRIWGNYSPIVAAQEVDTDPTGAANKTSGVYITDTQIIWLNPNTYSRIDYRIYGDD